MNTKNYLFLIVLLQSFFIGSAQDVRFKKGIVYVDDKECLKYDSDANNVSYQSLEGEDLFVLKFIRVGGILYTKVVFVESQMHLTSENYIFSKKLLVQKLLKSNVIENCTLNEEKIANFIVKFDEKVEERLNQPASNTIIIREDSQPQKGVNINIGR